MFYISQNIKYLVNLSGLTKDRFGAQFGVTKNLIGQYIAKKSKPKLETLDLIAKHHNITIDDLVNTDLTNQKAKPTLSPDSNNENKGEQEMDNNFLQSQITTLMDALGKAQESLNKQMEANAKQADLNQQLVEALTKRQAQPDYMNELEELKKRHDRTEQRFVALFAKFNEQEKKAETTRKAGSA